MKIIKLYLHSLRNMRHFQFFTEFRDLVQSAGAAALKIEAQFAAWLALFAQEDTAINKIVKSALTDEMETADHRRDTAIRGIKQTSKSALNHYWAVVRTASRRLQIVFDTYGDVAKMPLDDETAAITNLLQELKGAYAADVETAGLAPWVAELEAANNDYERLVKQRDSETAARTDLVLKQVRTQADAAYRVITERIEALALVEGGEAYANFIHRLNTVIERYR
jgi:hypothetical protein